jgi:hypothetical protein
MLLHAAVVADVDTQVSVELPVGTVPGTHVMVHVSAGVAPVQEVQGVVTAKSSNTA